MAAKKKPEPPTKEEVKAARAVMRRWFASRRKRHKRLRRGFASVADRNFYTWKHDMGIVLQSAARDVSLSPATVAERAKYAADAMAELIAERDPEPRGDKTRVKRLRTSDRWHYWQDLFDTMIHEMAAKSELAPHVIVDRARQIADAAMSHIKRRYTR